MARKSNCHLAVHISSVGWLGRNRLANCVLCALGVSILFAVEAVAQPSGPLSNVTWEQAEPDISAMDEAELRSLLTYLAECNDRVSTNPSILNACRSARVRYQTEFKRTRPIDSVIDNIEKIHEVRRAVRSLGITPNAPEYVADLEQKLTKAVGAALRAKPRR